MKIIDFEKKGNVIRFYLGEKTKDWGWTNSNFKNSEGERPDYVEPSESYYGDDWNDAPYQHNAGRVYSEFIKGYCDISFKFDDLVLEPADESDYYSRGYCKDQMVSRSVPCIIVVPAEIAKDHWENTFDFWIGHDKIKKYYFGDELTPDVIL